MRLEVHYRMEDHNGREPGARPELNVVPSPDAVDHPEIKASLIAFGEARAAEIEARKAHAQADLELPATEFKDEQALADALASKKRDPGPVHAEKQMALIRDLKRKHGAAKIALGRAVDDVRNAFEEHGDEWESQLEQQGHALTEQMARALDEYSELFAALELNYQTRSIGSGRGRGQFKRTTNEIRRPNGTPMGVAEIVECLKRVQEPPQAKLTPPPVDPTVKIMPNGNRVVDRKARIDEWNERMDAEADSMRPFGKTREERLADALARREAQELQRLANSTTDPD